MNLLSWLKQFFNNDLPDKWEERFQVKNYEDVPDKWEY